MSSEEERIWGLTSKRDGRRYYGELWTEGETWRARVMRGETLLTSITCQTRAEALRYLENQRDILDKQNATWMTRLPNAEPALVACPRCGSAGKRRASGTKGSLVLRYWRCTSCGNDWQTTEPRDEAADRQELLACSVLCTDLQLKRRAAWRIV